MKLLKINVTDNKIFINEPVEINTGEYRVTTVQFMFPDEWAGLIKKAKFGEYTETLVNDSCYFPIILRAGVVTIKVFGYSETEQNGETVMELVYSPQPTNIHINQGSYDYEHGDAPIVPEPDEEYLDKATLWDGYSAYFETLIDPPELAVLEFESVDIATMTLKQVVIEIEVINKKILDAQSDDVSDVCVNGHSVVTNHIADIPIPNTIVEDVKVNGSSVVDNNNVANISVPTNYVTTDTDQAITARKDFYWHSESDGVLRSQTLEVSSAELNYYGDKIDGENNTNDSFILCFPAEGDDGFIIIGKNDEECTYTAPKFTDGETYQLAVTDDIPTNYLTTNTVQINLTGSKIWTDGRDSFIGIFPDASPYLRIADQIRGTTHYYAGKIDRMGYDLVFPTTKGGTFALTSDIPDVSNLVTTDTPQTITAEKTFSYSSTNNGVLRDAYLTINPYEIAYLYIKDDSNDSNNSIETSFHVEFPQDLGYRGFDLTVEENGEICTYTFPIFKDGEVYQIATTAQIPTDISELAEDSTHRTVTDVEKNSWGSVVASDENGLPFTITDSYGNAILTIDDNGNIRTMTFSSKNAPKIPLTSISGRYLASTGNEGVYQWVDLPSKAPTLKVPWLIEQHRGYSSTTVAENTMAAFKRTWLNGADMIELDARLSADNVYVCCHDASITVGGVEYIIAETNADVLTNLVLSTDSEYGDCKIPTVEEVLKFCAHTDMLCNLDCKTIDPQTIAELVNKCGMSGRVIYANTDDNSENITNALGILQHDKHASFLFKLISGAITKWETGLTNNPEVFERSWCWKDKAHTDANVIASARAKGLKFLLNYVSTDNIQDVFALQPDCIEFADTTDFKLICDEYLESLNF